MKYTELSEDERVQKLKERLKMIETSTYEVEVELEEYRCCVKVATTTAEKADAVKQVEEYEAKLKFHAARMRAINKLLDAFKNTDQPLSAAG